MLIYFGNGLSCDTLVREYSLRAHSKIRILGLLAAEWPSLEEVNLETTKRILWVFPRIPNQQIYLMYSWIEK